MSKASEFIFKQIELNGPLDISSVMSIALSYYYATRDPLGINGDFITSPEISQMFGEIIGAYIADQWIKKGSPDPFILLECGPGRGTLLDDFLRATKSVKGFHAAMKLYLLETSPVLKQIQYAKIGNYHPQWISSLDISMALPDFPLFLVANEFVDALPIHQLVKSNNIWTEKVVNILKGDFEFDYIKAPDELLALVPDDLRDSQIDCIFEISPIRNSFIEKLCQVLQKNEGVALIIDYGHNISCFGDTLQAVKHHKFVDVLSDLGETDLTSHVDFSVIKHIAYSMGLKVYGPKDQGPFLKALGLQQRADLLKENLPAKQRNDIDMAVSRLCDKNEMGGLFKVISICDNNQGDAIGFI